MDLSKDTMDKQIDKMVRDDLLWSQMDVLKEQVK